MRVWVLCGLLLTMLCLTLPVMGEETTTGGIFIRDIKITNNGNSVFAEDFNKEELTGWTNTESGICSSASLIDDASKYCLYMNREIDEKAGLSRKIVCKKVGLLEFSAWVLCPSPAQQWEYNHQASSRTRIDLETGQGDHSFYFTIDLKPGETGYNVGMVWFRPELRELGNAELKCGSEKAVITPGKWTHLSFKLDPTSKTSTIFVDEKQVASCEYDPSKISAISYIDLTTWMGDQRRGGEDTGTYAKGTRRRTVYVRNRTSSG